MYLLTQFPTTNTMVLLWCLTLCLIIRWYEQMHIQQMCCMNYLVCKTHSNVTMTKNQSLCEGKKLIFCSRPNFMKSCQYEKLKMTQQIYYHWKANEKSFPNHCLLCNLEQYSKNYIQFNTIGYCRVNHQS